MNNKLYYGDNLEVLRDAFRTRASTSSTSIRHSIRTPATTCCSSRRAERGRTPASRRSTIPGPGATAPKNALARHRRRDQPPAAGDDGGDAHRHRRESVDGLSGDDGGAAGRAAPRAQADTGSLYLHCDPTASHYLKLVLDAVFGAENYRNEIVWKRTDAHSDAKHDAFGDVHDMIFFYRKTTRAI